MKHRPASVPSDIPAEIRRIAIHPKKIIRLRYLFEAYDGVVTMTTLDNEQGIAELMGPSNGMWDVVEAIIEELADELEIRWIDEGAPFTSVWSRDDVPVSDKR